MRIGAINTSVGRIQGYNYTSKINKNEEIKKQESMPAIRDTYESSAARVKTDFGGYNRLGQRTNKPANGDIMDGYARILNVNNDELSVKMKEKGVMVEDLVYPDKSEQLSEEPYTKAVLRDFATMERESLLRDSGMSGQELDDLVENVHKLF